MREELGPPEVRVAGIAARQYGVITVAQLAASGIDKSGIDRRLRAVRLHRVHRGVYAVGHFGLTREARFMAAVLACGSGAVLSHRSAAVHWNLLRPGEDEPVHVSLPSRSGRSSRRGIRIHRPRSLGSSDLTIRSRIPVTTPSRTILDLRAAKLEPRLLRRAIREAERPRYRLDPSINTDETRSDLERDFLRLCRRHRIPPPEVNVFLAPRLEVDFLWRSHNLVVETDGYEYHSGQIAFEDDHSRDLRLRRRGFTVLRYTGAQLENPAELPLVAAEVAARLAP